MLAWTGNQVSVGGKILCSVALVARRKAELIRSGWKLSLKLSQVSLMTESWIFALCACYTWNLIKLYGMMKLGLVCLFLFWFCFKQSSQGLLWLSNPLFPSKGCWELPVIYKTGMTVSLGEMISNSINISNQVLVLKFYEVIEIVGMFLQEAGQWGARQLTWGAVLLALGLKPGCSLELFETMAVVSWGDTYLPVGANVSRSKRTENLGSVSSPPIDLPVDLRQVPSFLLCLTQFSSSGKGLWWVTAASGRLTQGERVLQF